MQESEGANTLLQSLAELWISGGWLMLPLLILTIFIYYVAFSLWLHLELHFLIRSRIRQISDQQIASILSSKHSPLRHWIAFEASTTKDVKRHCIALQNEYLPFVNRRIRFLGAIIPAAPLMGLLGTVSGMLSVFDGMGGMGDKLQSMVRGISEALITTQMGLMVSIPAMLILSLIVQRRNALQQSIARLERFGTYRVLRVGCPITPPKDAKSKSQNQNHKTKIVKS